MKLIKKIMDKTFWLYVALGILNYSFCSAVMLFFKNVVKLEETPCLWISFILQSGISFVLNRWVTFRGVQIARLWPLKFVCSLTVCYLVAKVLLRGVFGWLIELPFFVGIAQWLQSLFAKGMEPKDFRINLVMLACTFTYCVINYVGQRYFVFRAVNDAASPEPQTET